MKVRGFAHTLITSAVATLFAACGGSQPPIAAPGAVPQTAASATRAERGGSWMLPEAKGEKLLYLSQDLATASAVYVFDYKTRKQVGLITALVYPYGQCVDAKGDVWITDLARAEIVEFAHGGANPIRTLSTYTRPIGCSVAPNGDLAVSTDGGSGSFGSSVLDVFKRASGSAYVYQSPDCKVLWVPGYDGKGNLYVKGEQFYSEYHYKVNVCELPANGGTLNVVSFNHIIADDGTIMWDGKHITIANSASGHTVIFRARESSSGNLTVIGQTDLVDSTCPHGFDGILQTFIVGKANTPVNHELGTAVFGGSGWSSCPGDFDAWHYPGGGDQTWSIPMPNVFGQSVSIPK